MNDEGGSDRRQRRMRLTSGTTTAALEQSKGDWGESLEAIVQETLVLLADLADPSSSELEAALFAKCLHDHVRLSAGNGVLAQEELAAFRNPVGFYVFSLLNRRYTCSEQLPPARELPSGKPPVMRLREVMATLAGQVSSLSVDLEDRPTGLELLAHLFDHVQESHSPDDHARATARTTGLNWCQTAQSLPHEARVAAIRNWHSRLQAFYRTSYRHRGDEQTWYAYPFVELAHPDGEHLILLMASPLDPQFIDEKVEERWRAPELLLAVFQHREPLDGSMPRMVRPLLKQAFARVLFTNILNQNSRTLIESSEERATILRDWVKIASEGLPGLLGREQAKAPFDGFEFCESVVRRVLCARIPGVSQSEVFPFDRAFIFREGGTESDLSDKPMALRILEASVLSNAAADRGRFLTSRERNIRGTEEFECDLSQKRVEAEDCFDFYVHPGNESTLILSRREDLSAERRAAVLEHSTRSRNPRQSDHNAYRIPVFGIDRVEDSRLDSAVYNILGRLIGGNWEERKVSHPGDRDESGRSWAVRTFKEDFERLRLSVTERADDEGLTFIADHGLRLDRDTPTLFALQRAYLAYLDDRFRDQDERFLKDRARQDNMGPEQIEALLARDKELRRQREQQLIHGTAVQDGAVHRSKVVFVSFSWELHDKNTQLWLDRSSSPGLDGADDEKAKALLGDEYSYTLVLVADSDPEKSQARLQAEREDLGLFFQLMMGSIWSARYGEYSHLEKRRRSIGASLQQFLHQVKGKLPNDADKRDIDELLSNLQKLIRSDRPPVEWVPVRSVSEISRRLLGEEAESDPMKRLSGLAQRVLKKTAGGTPEIRLQPFRIPPLSILWSEAIIRDAFEVAFKNAVEAAAEATDEQSFVSVQLQAVPRADSPGSDQWFLDLVIENGGGPIPSRRLQALNNPDPAAVRPGGKAGSTGIGVFLARFQLSEVIGFGADMVLANVSEDIVQCRIRIPAQSLQETTHSLIETEAGADPGGPYVLYVEDSPNVYEGALSFLQPLAARRGLHLEHCRGALRAGALIAHRLPALVLSDLHIQQGEDPEAPAMLRYGLELLTHLVTVGARQAARPPILLFTGEEAGSVRLQLEPRLKGHGYRWRDPGTLDAAALTAPGGLAVMPKKCPHDLDEEWMDELFAQAAARESARESKHRTVASEHPEQLDRIGSAAFLETSLDDLAALAGNAGIPSDTVVVVRASAKSRPELAKVLHRWFVQPALPDPAPTFPGQETLYAVTDSVIHHHLVLVVELSGRAYADVPPRLLYWALGRNVVLSSAAAPAGEIAARWVAFPREEKGPLSRLRHDLKAGWSHSELQPLLGRLVEYLNVAESQLLLPNAAVEALEEALRNNARRARTQLDKLLLPSDATELRSRVLTAIERVGALLAEAREKPNCSPDDLIRQEALLDHLSHFLGGE